MKNSILLGIMLVLFACDERGFETYEGGNYLSFEKDMEKDSVIVSFFYYPGQTEVKVPLKVILSGAPLSKPASFSLAVVKEETDLDAGNYELPESYIFGKDRVEDTVWIKLIYAPCLKEKAFRLVVQIKGNENLMPGVSNLQKAKLVVSGIAARPEWWTRDIERTYLGKYSDAKYQLFIQITRVTDLTSMKPGMLTALALQLKYYLQKQTDAGTPVYDEENQEYMKVPVIG